MPPYSSPPTHLLKSLTHHALTLECRGVLLFLIHNGLILLRLKQNPVEEFKIKDKALLVLDFKLILKGVVCQKGTEISFQINDKAASKQEGKHVLRVYVCVFRGN